MSPKAREMGRLRWKFGENHCKGRAKDGTRMGPAGWDRDGIGMRSAWDQDGIRMG